MQIHHKMWFSEQNVSFKAPSSKCVLLSLIEQMQWCHNLIHSSFIQQPQQQMTWTWHSEMKTYTLSHYNILAGGYKAWEMLFSLQSSSVEAERSIVQSY